MNPKGVIATTLRTLNDVGSEGAATIAGAILEDLAAAGYEVREKAEIERQRERLARHLYARYGIGGWTWEEMDERSRDQFRAEADEVLAVIAGKES